jgi:hypothetical protein
LQKFQIIRGQQDRSRDKIAAQPIFAKIRKTQSEITAHFSIKFKIDKVTWTRVQNIGENLRERASASWATSDSNEQFWSIQAFRPKRRRMVARPRNCWKYEAENLVSSSDGLLDYFNSRKDSAKCFGVSSTG